MEAVCSSETPVDYYQITRRNIPEDRYLYYFFRFEFIVCLRITVM
jgi:hypothetical protein